MRAFVYALLAHGLIGGLDVVVNHELIARLPAQPRAARELSLHSARELIFALLFAALAWFEWYGLGALAIAALLLGELLVSCVDTVLEPQVRLLPPTERVAHVLLFVNLGVIGALLGSVLLEWWKLPTGLAPTYHGWGSWVLSALALGALGWSVRDALSAARTSDNKGTGQGERLALVSHDQNA
ncbi:MAG: hypothetical protein V4723_01405 [Pseudomonadota bacterium]